MPDCCGQIKSGYLSYPKAREHRESGYLQPVGWGVSRTRA